MLIGRLVTGVLYAGLAVTQLWVGDHLLGELWAAAAFGMAVAGVVLYRRATRG